MKQVLIATKNKGKVKEFEKMFKKNGIEVTSLLDSIDAPDVEETGSTFKENAIIKAEAICNWINKPVIADDSGLVVDALNGEPGVYSARYAGVEKNDQQNLQKVLKNLEEVPMEKRTARFVCSLAVAIPGKETFVVEGTCEGRISEMEIGNSGFGYDPIFYIDEKQKTMAQLTSDEKNSISHRANALKKLEEKLSEM